MTMMLFRRAKETDLAGILHLAEQSGVGLTTLPKSRELLAKRLAWSAASFEKSVQAPKDEYYLFVLEDPDSGNIAGTSAIEAATGHDAPFYSYKILKHSRISHSLNIRTDYEVLSLVNDNQGHSEICTLFLQPDYRKNGNGLLLSSARFLFIAQYSNRFAPTIMAEIRGTCDDNGRSPFWDAVGQHFFNMDFAAADKLTTATNKQFIADLMPRNPVYIQLLSQAAQDIIGKPHQSAVAAMNILLREGFRYNNYVDIFDGGPTVEAPKQSIRTIAANSLMVVKNISDDVSSKRFILANTQMDFRATISQTIVNEQKNACILSKETADLLQVKQGEYIRIVPLQAEPATSTKVRHE